VSHSSWQKGRNAGANFKFNEFNVAIRWRTFSNVNDDINERSTHTGHNLGLTLRGE
jgi:hypothetical protein